MGKLLLLVIVFAALVYTALWLAGRRSAARSTRAARPRPSAPRRPVGPDDDEDFLRELERRRRQHPDNPAP